ncbi:MAG: RsmE family RNA methyltransferase [Rhodothermales bacterium]
MTTFFYAPPNAFQTDQYVVLPEEEAAHAIRVLRKRPGDEIEVVDGEGGWYRVCLDHVGKRTARGVILEKRRDVGEPDVDVSIGLALLKNRNRFETFLEKAVELGVREVIPLMTHRTEKARWKAERARNIVLAAMKQCGRSRLIRLADPLPMGHLFHHNTVDLALIGHEKVEPGRTIMKALNRQPKVRTVRVLIGPEGGFTDEEVGAARQAGYVPVSLGPRRLRAETAALVAAASVMLTWGG